VARAAKIGAPSGRSASSAQGLAPEDFSHEWGRRRNSRIPPARRVKVRRFCSPILRSQPRRSALAFRSGATPRGRSIAAITHDGFRGHSNASALASSSSASRPSAPCVRGQPQAVMASCSLCGQYPWWLDRAPDARCRQTAACATARGLELAASDRRRVSSRVSFEGDSGRQCAWRAPRICRDRWPQRAPGRERQPW